MTVAKEAAPWAIVSCWDTHSLAFTATAGCAKSVSWLPQPLGHLAHSLLLVDRQHA